MLKDYYQVDRMLTRLRHNIILSHRFKKKHGPFAVQVQMFKLHGWQTQCRLNQFVVTMRLLSQKPSEPPIACLNLSKNV